MNALTLKDLNKTYENGTVALTNVNLEIKRGDFFALLGANGAGKTTLIGILSGLVNKTSGKVTLFGHDLDEDFNAAKQKIGLVPQEFNFSIFEKVIDIVLWQAGYFGIPRKEARRRAEKILTALSLWEKKDQPSNALSGGMKRRLMIARALIHEPEFLLLDEPTAGVDVELRHGMWDYLNELNAQGTTILLTTHYLEEAEQLCRNLAIIKQGEVVRQGSVKSMLKNMEQQSYVVEVEGLKPGLKLNKGELKIVDDGTIEVDLAVNQTVTDLVENLKDKGIHVRDIRPKANRLEQLFLKEIKPQ